jgi:hypothetical protein
LLIQKLRFLNIWEVICVMSYCGQRFRPTSLILIWHSYSSLSIFSVIYLGHCATWATIISSKFLCRLTKVTQRLKVWPFLYNGNYTTGLKNVRLSSWKDEILFICTSEIDPCVLWVWNLRAYGWINSYCGSL